MNKLLILIISTFVVSVCFIGCQTTEQKMKAQRQQQWEGKLSQQVLELEEKLFDLKSSLEVLKRKQSSLEMRIADQENELRNMGKRQNAEDASLRGEIKATRQAMDKKMQIILEEVVKENERLLARILEAKGSGYMQGYEHVVKSGETLSEIARHYGVAVKTIVEANDLSDPNSLRVGQKIFIPQ